jgi:hypothetical protein
MHTSRLAREHKYAFWTICLDRSTERVKNNPTRTKCYLHSTYQLCCSLFILGCDCQKYTVASFTDYIKSYIACPRTTQIDTQIAPYNTTLCVVLQ